MWVEGIVYVLVTTKFTFKYDYLKVKFWHLEDCVYESLLTVLPNSLNMHMTFDLNKSTLFYTGNAAN